MMRTISPKMEGKQLLNNDRLWFIAFPPLITQQWIIGVNVSDVKHVDKTFASGMCDEMRSRWLQVSRTHSELRSLIVSLYTICCIV
jgi:hypothetical protein